MVSYPIRQAEAKQLPYLQACVFEGLRKFPPLSQLRERVVPSEGDMINGHRIPGGTYIGFNIWGAQLDKVFGDDPDVFRPERWLIDDQERLTAMRETLELIFGHGATKCLGMPMAMMELNKVIFEVRPLADNMLLRRADTRCIAAKKLRHHDRQPLSTVDKRLPWHLSFGESECLSYAER